ncbi:MAG: hypothetical protein K0S32_548 [Bacteroidetes bacterium]|nr:hypothetical protein [Bacteroidota bacterium]
MADHKSTYGIYFPDQIKFSNVMMEADKETSEALLGFLNKELAAPNEHNYIILDGSEYRINVYGDNSKEFTWKHNDELNDKTRNFVKFLGKIVG